MQSVIIVIHLMVVVAMIGLVLLQRSEGGGLGMGGGGGFMTSRGAGNVLTRATAVLAAVFFTTSLIMSILAGVGRTPTSILDNAATPPAAPGAPGTTTPPISQGGRGVLDQLRGDPTPPRSQ